MHKSSVSLSLALKVSLLLGLAIGLWSLGFHSKLEAQKLFVPDRVEQGRILQSFIYPVRGLQSVEFTLLDAAGKVVSQSEGFLLNYERGTLAKKLNGRMREWVNVGLIGILSDQAPGNYTLRAAISKTRSRSQMLERPVRIQSHDYPSQTIKLSREMDGILNSKDPDVVAKKRSQSNELWATLKRKNPENLYYDGILLRPIVDGKGWKSSGYGYVRKYVYPGGRVTTSIHKGYDIAAAQGIGVLASGSGLVVMAKDRIVTGKTVILSVLPGVFVKYQHLSTLNVAEGAVLEKGDLIGEVGKTGFATGNHLHTELWVSGKQVDPKPYFDVPLIDTNEIISMITEN